MSYIEISDDDDSFVLDGVNDNSKPVDSFSISSDDSEEVIEMGAKIKTILISDEEEDIKVEIRKKKQTLIKDLFRTAKHSTKTNSNIRKPVISQILKPKGFEKMIGGVKVQIPVEPYGSQTALMFKVITAINKSQNCLLESPTGSGKTLALLCSALAWVRQEKNRISQLAAKDFLNQHPVLKDLNETVEYVSSQTRHINLSPEKFFNKPVFGQKSIYDEPPSDAVTGNSKRQECLDDLENSGDCNDGLVKIHKKRRLNDSELGESSSSNCSQELSATPEKKSKPSEPLTPPNIRNLYSLVNNLRLRTSMLVNSSVPKIYYGARTHKQLQQVVREFARTDYCGDLLMTVLSSRDYSCIREFDRQTWSSKNDMCRACIKPSNTECREDSNCKFFDNRMALNHKCLPPAFELEDLVAVGEEKKACPYFAARAMATYSHIVFCPYNYLIEPSIRSSMQIDLEGNIVIIDEAHNIEDICRDAATFTFSRDSFQAAIKELEVVTSHRFANQDAMNYVEYLLQALKNWDEWFQNQTPLINKQAMNGQAASEQIEGGQAVFKWQVEHFVETLDNHNIGRQHCNEFRQNAENFCKRLREDPRTLYGVTQATGTLIESIDTVLGYLFGCSGKYMDDFKPALIRNGYGNETFSGAKSWRQSQFNRAIEKETLSLRLMCMNPAVIFEGLKQARCIILASGTLTPLISLHSELGTTFPLQVSPNHVIPPDRVWVGTLSTCPDGSKLDCSSRSTDLVSTQDALGKTILYVSRVTPNGVLCFLPSYHVMNKLVERWRNTGIWAEVNELKHVFMESRTVRDHNDIMEDFYKYVSTDKGALLLAVYRGKVSEGMDFKDHQARAVITVGVPYPNTYDMNVKEKMKYNDRYATERGLLPGKDWLLVQAYRALNQAVGRCVRHRGDWGGVLLVDSRFSNPHYTKHLSKWVRNYLGNNHHTFQSLVHSPNGLESFMQNMTIQDREDS
ncbi:Fanconi anemia group J protein homolog [Battus philenor]|uniref:Fanconi anemia group J protein homolog n=1 Tax=Battus philenor TaxID=42288 RepID=UPI0035D0FE05